MGGEHTRGENTSKLYTTGREGVWGDLEVRTVESGWRELCCVCQAYTHHSWAPEKREIAGVPLRPRVGDEENYICVAAESFCVLFCDMAAVGFFEWAARGGEESEREIDIGGK